jgi:manganese efflux pump family protein
LLALVLVACSLGLSNFAGAIGIGLTGSDASIRWRVGVIFGVFEAGMPVAGLAAGRQLTASVGDATRWAGAGLLIAVGFYELAAALRGPAAGGWAPSGKPRNTTAVLASGFALSIDNLAAGFALGTLGAGAAGILLSAVVIGGVSVAMSLAGLELGARIGAAAGQRSELLGAVILIAAGAGIGAGLL